MIDKNIMTEENLDQEELANRLKVFLKRAIKAKKQGTTTGILTSDIANKYTEYKGYKVHVSFGQYNVSRIPWMTFLNKKYNFKTRKGVYPYVGADIDNNRIISHIGFSNTEQVEISNENLQSISEFNQKSFEKKINDLESIDDLVIYIDEMIKFYDKLIFSEKMNKKTQWYEVYESLTHELLKVSSGTQLYEILNNNKNKEKFLALNSSWVKDKGFEQTKSYDPIHIFTSFNHNQIKTDQERVDRINFYLNVLNNTDKLYYENIDFSGIPIVNVNNIFYRPLNIQEKIWNFFKELVDNGLQSTTIDPFIESKNWKGVGIPVLTMFLFYIDSKKYISLDSNTEKYLKRRGVLNRAVKNKEDYFSLFDLNNEQVIKTDAIRNIVKKSYIKNKHIELDEDELAQIEELIKESSQEEDETILENQFKSDISIFSTEIKKSLSKKSQIEDEKESTKKKKLPNEQLKLVYLEVFKTENRKDKKYTKILSKDKFYFNNTYSENKNGDIVHDINKDFPIYSFNDEMSKEKLDINISAIVGKNGSGKSTIIDLLLIAINNIAYHSGLNKAKLVEDMNFEVCIHLGVIYKFRIDNQRLVIFKSTKEDQKKSKIKYYNFLEVEDFDLYNFFYTLIVNYSQHSFNIRNYGDWLNELFHKNDGYQLPVVITPFRDDGNIKINIENDLVISRLISNLLEKNANKNLTKNFKTNKIELELNLNKLDYIYIDPKDKIEIDLEFFGKEYIEEILDSVKKVFLEDEPDLNIDIKKVDKSLNNFAYLYLFKKLIKITINYKQYQDYYSFDNKEIQNIDEFLEKIKNDDSHVTLKFKQIINFFKYKLIQRKNITLDIDNLASKINIESSNNTSLKTIELIPPSFYNIKIYNDDVSFDTLSSGEKQKIYSINSILYHLRNISSVSHDLIKYKHVNIILDEIELYFHPEYQREYINKLLKSIKEYKSLGLLDTIESLNFLFVTHSPFILSDIPNIYLMPLDIKENETTGKFEARQVDINYNCFGANIHELLSSAFFLDKGTIGAYASRIISRIISFHKRAIVKKENKESYLQKRDEFMFIKESIGESYIQGIIENHIKALDEFFEINNENNEIESLKKRIKELEKELKK
ncbi:hypothetical protein CRV03_03535 [Arcobacter sp. F155]|uniref:hypothetical protein n=1 Tax=Arcobacter sp. F155 TaxID=2044512 RepID=UPI00100AFC5F|nr:hypothetical protein [Arcobacter sp. F155]RXJ78054.1 hypothetical protein CRV03_03535 [Arcobacter sp. F155]